MTKLVVVVDMQYDFVMPDGALYVPGAEKLIVPMIQYLMKETFAGSQVIYTMDTHSKDNYHLTEESKEFPLHCNMDTIGWQNVLPIPGDAYIWVKNVFDPWADNGRFVEQEFYDYDVDIIGVAADYCVKYAYEGFKDRGFPNVRVIPELTVGIKENPYALGTNRKI